MTTNIGLRYFDEIKEAWAPFASTHRVIPFCTPVIERPIALVIGVNHSNFAIGAAESDGIADAFAQSLPTEVSYSTGSFQFADGLRAVCREANIEINDQWVGTNRCAVQTIEGGTESLEKRAEFAGCQQSMDAVLKRLVFEIIPSNVLLVSYYASALFYQKAKEEAGFETIPPKLIKTPQGHPVQLIPLPLFSYPNHRKVGIKRLKESFVRR